MKTKKKTYVLLALVMLVWGTIVYKIITALNPSLPEIAEQKLVVNTNYKIETKVDTFSISMVNRDPFLGILLKKPSKKTTVKKKKPLQWKPIQYQGVIEKSGTKQQIFIVSISNKQHLLKKGQTKDSITLVYGGNKSVTLRYKHRLKTFPIKK